MKHSHKCTHAQHKGLVFAIYIKYTPKFIYTKKKNEKK